MLITHQHPHNKAIMVSVLGAPNVGKSSLVNCLLGQDLSVVTRKAQTTRNKIHCVFTVDRTEIILVDTPGLHKSNQEFNKRINEQAREGADGVDLNLLLINLKSPVMDQIKDFNSFIERKLGKTWVVFTKSDLIENAEDLPLKEVFEQAKSVIPNLEKYFVISSKTEDNVNQLIGSICDEAQSGPHLYPNGQVSNKNTKFFASEYIREQAFNMLQDEIPYDLAVVIDEFHEFYNKKTEQQDSRISATILVTRASQRAIVIGSKGARIKEIGVNAREKIKSLVEGDVHLNLHVKVSPKWAKNNFLLEEMGLPRARDSRRVWHKR